MGLQQISADTVQRLIPKPSVRSDSQPDKSSEKFESYLDKARSARGPEGETRDEPVEPADEPREANEDAGASQDAVAESSAPIIVNTPIPVSEEGKGERADADAPLRPLAKPLATTTALADANVKPTVQQGTLPLATQADSKNAASDASKTQAAAEPGATATNKDAENLAVRREESAIKTPSDATLRQVTKDASDARVVRQPETTPKDNADTRSEQSVQQSRDAGRAVTESNRQSTQNETDAREQQSQQQSARKQSEQVQRDGQVAEPTLHEQKMKASIEDRRRGDVDQPQAKAEQPPVQVKAAGAVKARMDVLAETLGTKGEPLPTAVKVLSGDKAAENLGRFLLSSTQGGEGDGANAAGRTSSPASGSASATVSSGSTSNAPASTFADTLAASLDAPESLDNAARLFKANGANGKYHVTMQLDPPELGQIRLQVRMQGQGLTLQVDAESSSVAKLIESRLSLLRESLAAHGIRVERADVVVRPPSGGETNAQHQQHNSGQQAGTHGAGDPYGDLPGDGRPASGSQDEQRQDADLLGDTYENNDGTTRVDGEDAARGWTNRTAATELSLDLVA